MQLNKVFLLVAVSLILCTSCEHTVSTETVVHEDGTLDKKITFIDKIKQDFLDSISVKGWKRTEEIEKDSSQKEVVTPLNSDTSRNKIQDKKIVILSKTFHSADEANHELGSLSDTLFRITSKFEKKFRWFYTYLYYSDTYQALNRMEYPPDDYLTQEDYGFIERLPREGAHITKVDSLYLKQLTSKIFDTYGERALFESMCTTLLSLIKQKQIKISDHWIDSLQRHKEKYFALFKKNEKGEDSKKVFLNESTKLMVLDSMEMLITEKMEVDSLFKDLTARTSFMSYASEGKYINRIAMPWNIVRSNADSVSGKELFWSPPTIKFLLKDYTMFAESRKLNLWPLVTSILFVGFAGYLFLRKKSSNIP